MNSGTARPRRAVRTHLPTTDKDDRLARDIGHRQRSADLIVNRVPLRDQHPVNATPSAMAADRREVAQRTIKLLQLVNSLVANERLADEDNLVGIVR